MFYNKPKWENTQKVIKAEYKSCKQMTFLQNILSFLETDPVFWSFDLRYFH